MSNNDIDVPAVIRHLSDWASKLIQEQLCQNVYLFGSIINRESRHFIVSGAIESDIDILVEFSDEHKSALERTNSIVEIQKTISDVERELAAILDRDQPKKPILSILPVTQYEIYQCIHKGFDPKIFTHTIFLDLQAPKSDPISLNKYIDYKYHMENIELFSISRIAQKIRNNFLKTNLIGQQVAKTKDDHYDALPKEMMRAGAMLKFVKAGGDIDPRNQFLRTDLEEGEIFIFEKIQSLSKENDTYSELHDKLKARRFARAASKSLVPRDILCLSEIMYDEMRGEAIQSVREVIDKILEKDMLQQ